MYGLMARTPSAVRERFGWDEAMRLGWNRPSIMVFGFRALGERATGAVSRLSELTRATNEEVSMNAQATLTWIGNAGLPTFIEAVTNGSSTKSLRVSAITEIGMVQKRHTNADSALSLLLGCLRDNDPEIAAAAARAAGEFGTQADTAVPALTLAAQGSNAVVRVAAADSLRKLTNGARYAH